MVNGKVEKIQGRRHHTLIETGLLNDVHEKKDYSGVAFALTLPM
jgi:hypothetical protein